MARKKKLINKTNVPQYAIERFARCVFDDIRAFYDSEEGQREFAAWKAEQAALKVHNKTARATDTAALAVFIDVSFFLVLAVLNQGVLTRRYENTNFRISRNKQIIRTRLPQGRFGSDYIALVRMFIRDLIKMPERTIIFQKTHIFQLSSFAVQCTCKGGFCIMKVKDVKHKVTLDDFERRMIINCVNQARTFLHYPLKKV